MSLASPKKLFVTIITIFIFGEGRERVSDSCMLLKHTFGKWGKKIRQTSRSIASVPKRPCLMEFYLLTFGKNELLVLYANMKLWSPSACTLDTHNENGTMFATSFLSRIIVKFGKIMKIISKKRLLQPSMDSLHHWLWWKC